MAADTLIFKKKGSLTKVKITKGMANGHTPYEYSQKINIKNYKDMALWLQDLKFLHNAPIDKAIAHYREIQGKWFLD